MALGFVLNHLTHLRHENQKKSTNPYKDGFEDDCEAVGLNASVTYPPVANRGFRKSPPMTPFKLLDTGNILNSMGDSNVDFDVFGFKDKSVRTFHSIDNRYGWNCGQSDHVGIVFRSLNNIQDNNPDTLRII